MIDVTETLKPPTDPGELIRMIERFAQARQIEMLLDHRRGWYEFVQAEDEIRFGQFIAQLVYDYSNIGYPTFQQRYPEVYAG